MALKINIYVYKNKYLKKEKISNYKLTLNQH